MPTPTKGPRLGGTPAHQRAILSNLATSLFEHGSITTTEAKARRLRPFAERLITKAKRGDLHNRRQVLSVVRDKTVVHILFTEIGPRFANRPGGYTRITKLGPRQGDNAPMAVIELVQEDLSTRSRGTQASAAPAKKSAKKAAAQPTATRTEEETPAVADASETEATEAETTTSEATETATASEPDATESEATESNEAESDATESAAADEGASPEAAAATETAEDSSTEEQADGEGTTEESTPSA